MDKSVFGEILDPERTLVGALGLEIEELGSDRARGGFNVAHRVLQPYGIVHGGAMVSLAESLASAATAKAVVVLGFQAVAQGIDVNFVRPVSEGRVSAEAVLRRKGRTAWIWDIDLTDSQGRLCALARCTVAVRPQPTGHPEASMTRS